MAQDDSNIGVVGFTRIPNEVAGDRRVSGVDLKVYWAIAQAHRKSPFVSIGQRQVALLADTSRSQVSRSVAALVEAGHLRVQEHGGGRKRAVYYLVSGVFQWELPPGKEVVKSFKKAMINGKGGRRDWKAKTGDSPA